jgi:tetratricopeptide (TPR) repeat protein
MDPSEIDALVQRLVANPHDEDALAYAHNAGASDPKSYAFLLEKVGTETRDPSYAAHWLSEAANVWSTTLGDAHRAARVLMMAIDKDPTQSTAAERLAQLYRDKGDVKALVALIDRRSKALLPMLAAQPEMRAELAAMHEELGRLWADAPLVQPKKAIDAYRKAIELDPNSAIAIYSLRELLKAQGQFAEALQMYEAELAIEPDPARRMALFRDEAATRKLAGDLQGATRALANARQIDDGDPALQQEYAASVLDRIGAGENVPQSERSHAAELLVALAEVYDGEHGLAYAGGALDIDPGHDRGLQLFVYYARTTAREGDVLPRYLAYVRASSDGSMLGEARHALAASYEAAGDYRAAVEQLEPLRAAGDPVAADKLKDLYALAAQQPAGPVPTAQSVPPPPITGAQPTAATPFAPAGLATGVEDSIAQKRAQLPADRLQGILDAATMLAGKGKKQEAFAKYREVLDSEPAHPEALAWVEDYLRTKRDYGQLRDVLLNSVRAMGSISDASVGGRKERLREIAGLCEGNLRDIDGAISAWKQLLALDRADEAARQALTRLLEKSQRWDDLASLLEQEATAEADPETKIALEKKLASLEETKRKDFVAAAEAWSRIARLTSDDAHAVSTAARLFEKADRNDLAARVIADTAPNLDDPIAKGNLLEHLGELRETLNDLPAAADAYATAAEVAKNPKLWDNAERCYTTAERWDRAANAAMQRAAVASDPKEQARHYARASDLFAKAGDVVQAVQRIEQAADLDPIADDYAAAVVDRFTQSEQWDKLVAHLAKRGDRLPDRGKRVAIRTQAATLYATKLNDKERAREQWLKVLEDGDDREALEKLIDYAVEREDHTEAATLLRRLGNIAIDKADKARIALREAELLAEGVGDVDMAIVRYESILSELDPTCRPALQAIADLQEARDQLPAAADALERELKLVADPVERGQIAARLARLYEQLDDPKSAIRALEIVRKADLEDFDALTRLCELCERTEQWDRVAELLAQRIEVEADETEASAMTKRLAEILADKLDRGDEALAALTELADQGDANIRAAYVDLGDRLGWKGIVAQKLVEWWFEARQGAERTAQLRGAFERFVEVGRDQDAARVAIEVIRSKGGDRALAERLEDLAVKTSDQDALAFAHDLLARELSGAERADELVRQAEVKVKAGLPRTEALQHGEAGLTSVSPAEAEPLLERLAQIASKPYEIVDLYERQVSRCKTPLDRTRALARAAQVAATKGAIDRARGFFELALTGSPTDDTLALLEGTAREGDRATGGEKLRRALCGAMAQGGQGARDGGRTRGALLRRAASMAHRDLGDVEAAFGWLGDALVAHVDTLTLDALEGLGEEVGDPRRSEAALSHALTEVFDGPLVRQLLGRRAKIRREQMDDRAGAAADLKKLHDLSPNDHAVMEELSALLTDLGDYRGMVQLYEDQILRGKDMGARAELARKVARMWEEQLTDAREAADAWRRVLRMKPGDLEAQQGLERAKGNMLKRPDPGASDAYAPPKLVSASMPAAPPEPAATAVAPAPPGRDSESMRAAMPTQHEMPSEPPATEAEPPPEDQFDGNLSGATMSNPLPDEPPTPTAMQAPRSHRPKDLWFRSSQDEATMSALSESGMSESLTSVDRPAPQSPQLTPSDGVYTSVDKKMMASGSVVSPMAASRALDESHTETGAHDLSRTNESPSFSDEEEESLSSTAARPLAEATAPAVPPARASTKRLNPDGSEEILIADDFEDLVEVVDEGVQSQSTTMEGTLDTDPTDQGSKPSERARQKSTPPPLPKI